MAAHTCNFSTWEAEADQSELQSELETNLYYIASNPVSKKKKKKKNKQNQKGLKKTQKK
jgi:hypothetical protein